LVISDLALGTAAAALQQESPDSSCLRQKREDKRFFIIKPPEGANLKLKFKLKFKLKLYFVIWRYRKDPRARRFSLFGIGRGKPPTQTS
jgi:hypothetical protein